MTGSTHRAIQQLGFAAAIAFAATSPAFAEAPPIEAYAELPAAYEVRLAPDGNKLGIVGAVRGQDVLRVKNIDDAGDVALNIGGKRPQFVLWKSERRLVAGVLDVWPSHGSGWLNVRPYGALIAIDSDGGNGLDIGHWSTESARPIEDTVLAPLYADPDHVLLSTRRGAARASVNEVEGVRVLTGAYPPGSHIGELQADETGVARIARGIQTLDQVDYVSDSPNAEFREIHRIDANGPLEFMPLAFVPGQRASLYVIATDPASGKNGLWTYRADTPGFERLVDANVAGAPRPFVEDGRLISYLGADNETRYLDPAWQKDQEAARKALTMKFVRAVDRSRDGTRTLFKATDPGLPSSWWLLDRRTEPAKFTAVIEDYAQLKDKDLAPVKEVTYTARDGLTITAYVTLPRGHHDGPLPFVVLPHDGPYGCDAWNFNYVAQFLASRGWGVLQPEFRGSSCQGAGLESRGFGQIGYAMQDDITDGTRWLIAEKYADPSKICIVGDGFGGYAALEGVVKEPDLYRCAAAWAPVTDLKAMRIGLLGSGPRDDIKLARLGDDSERLSTVSPVRHADRIKVPVLLMHGRQDYTVQPRYTEWMESALKDAGKSVETIYVEGADHFRDEYPSRLAWLQALDRFLGTNLGRPPAQVAALP